jgi:hypothetical protein
VILDDLRRRFLLVLTVLALVVVSGAIGVGMADWPFLQRSWRLAALPDSGEWPDSFYQPAVRIGGAAAALVPPADPATPSIEPAALTAAAAWAEANNSVALLVTHREKLVLERYWQGMKPDQLFSGRAMSRSLAGMLAGFAVLNGKLSLDDRLDKYRVGPRAARRDHAAAIAAERQRSRGSAAECGGSSRGRGFGRPLARRDAQLLRQECAPVAGQRFRAHRVVVPRGP